MEYYSPLMLCAVTAAAIDVCALVLIIAAYREKSSGKKRWDKMCEENGIPVHSGVFLQVTGPQYETPAEIRMYRALGADTVAMSLAVEVLAARRMDMKVCGLSCVSNMAAGMEEEGFSHDTIEDSVHDALDHYRTLVNGLLDSLAEAP